MYIAMYATGVVRNERFWKGMFLDTEELFVLKEISKGGSVEVMRRMVSRVCFGDELRIDIFC